MSNWMTLNESAINDTPTQQTESINGNTTVIQHITNNYYTDDDSEVYDWEPIRGE
jgi:hypothetical protein